MIDIELKQYVWNQAANPNDLSVYLLCSILN